MFTATKIGTYFDVYCEVSDILAWKNQANAQLHAIWSIAYCPIPEGILNKYLPKRSVKSSMHSLPTSSPEWF